jgi:hypothetical protein
MKPLPNPRVLDYKQFEGRDHVFSLCFLTLSTVPGPHEAFIISLLVY